MNGMIVKPDFLKGILLMTAVVVLSGLFSPLYAQEPPPRPVVITVNHSQPMAFGAFTPGASGGSITVPPDGSARTATGTVIPLSLGMLHTPAMFYIRANPGTVISVLSGTTSTLTGSGGGTLLLTVQGTYPASPFVTMLPYQQQTTVLVGGTLTVGTIGSNPAGNYSGTIDVTFVQE